MIRNITLDDASSVKFNTPILQLFRLQISNGYGARSLVTIVATLSATRLATHTLETARMAAHQEATFAARIRARGTNPAWNTTLVASYADKLAFKAYAASKGVDTVRTLMGTDNWEGLRPRDLPSDCLLKDAGGSGRTLLIRNHRVVSAKSTPTLKGLHIRHDWERIRRASLQFWAHSRSHTKGEPWYQHIRPRFFVEELLSPLPTDFKVHITHGIVRSIMVVTGRNGPGPTRCLGAACRAIPAGFPVPWL